MLKHAIQCISHADVTHASVREENPKKSFAQHATVIVTSSDTFEQSK